MTTFENINPIVDEDGTIWDLYWMTSLIISTDINTSSPTLYAEFWPCRQNGESKLIKNNLQGYEIRSITVENIFNVSDSDPMVNQVMDMVLQILKSAGQQQGIFK